MTFSLVARCEKTGMFGAAVASSSPAVAARCLFARAGAGAACSQNITDPALGERMLNLLADGAGAGEAINAVCRGSRHIEYRQLLAVDGGGATAVFSGDHVLGTWAEARRKNLAAAGNLLAHRGVIDAMADGYAGAADAHMGDRLVAALAAALAAGGEAGAVHSAGIKIAHQTPWPYVDLRCDWRDADCPVAQLRRAWEVYKPQMDDYIQRALQPRAAPGFNAAGAACARETQQ